MQSAFRATLIMMLIALIASVTAAYYYPWPEIESSGERINQPLFEALGNDFDLDGIRGIEIVKFNDDRNEIQDVKLRRRGESWIIPAVGNFVATNNKRISDVSSALSDRKIREEMSDKQEDHIKYGVVDPAEYATAIRSSLGTKLILEGRQGEQLASLIVGKAVKSESQVPQRFVRIPDQPQVYVIDFDASLLATNLESWIDPNLLRLASATSPNGQQPAMIEIDSYRIDPKKIAEGTRERIYQARFAMKGNQLGFDYLQVPAADDAWEKIKINQQQMSELASWVRVINRLEVSDARRKSKELIEALRKPSDDFPQPLNDELNRFGFNKTAFKDGEYEFDAAGGEFTCVTADGVRMNVYVGSFAAGDVKTASGNLARFLMINAVVDPSQFPIPEKKADDESDRAYLRAVAEREKKLNNANLLVRELDKIYADWIYVVDQEIVENLIPTLTITPADKAEETPQPAAAENPESEAEKQSDDAAGEDK
jgi:hypothetical protein